MESVNLANRESISVCEVWEWPDAFDSMASKDLLAVQNAIDGKNARISDQVGDNWTGRIVPDVLGMDVTTDKKQLNIS